MTKKNITGFYVSRQKTQELISRYRKHLFEGGERTSAVFNRTGTNYFSESGTILLQMHNILFYT